MQAGTWAHLPYRCLRTNFSAHVSCSMLQIEIKLLFRLDNQFASCLNHLFGTDEKRRIYPVWNSHMYVKLFQIFHLFYESSSLFYHEQMLIILYLLYQEDLYSSFSFRFFLKYKLIIFKYLIHFYKTSYISFILLISEIANKNQVAGAWILKNYKNELEATAEGEPERVLSFLSPLWDWKWLIGVSKRTIRGDKARKKKTKSWATLRRTRTQCRRVLVKGSISCVRTRHQKLLLSPRIAGTAGQACVMYGLRELLVFT